MSINIPNFENIRITDEKGYLTPAALVLFQQLFTELQTMANKILLNVENDIEANSSTTQEGATQIQGTRCRVSMASISNASIILQPINNNDRELTVYVRNDSANTIRIYPNVGASINALGTNNPYTLTAGSNVSFTLFTSSQWYTFN